MILNYFTYKNDSITCSKCGWKGTGKELILERISEEHLICDFECPKCYEHIGFWQAPLIKEIEDWKKEHPNWKEDYAYLSVGKFFRKKIFIMLEFL